MEGETLILPSYESLDLLPQYLSVETAEIDRQDSPTHQDIREAADSSNFSEPNPSLPADLTLSGKSASFSKLPSTKASNNNSNNGQVVKLPPIADSGVLKSSKRVPVPGNGSTKFMSKTSTNNPNIQSNNYSSATTQVTLYSNQHQKSSNSSISRNTFPSDASPPISNTNIAGKSRQPSISRSSISSTSNGSNTGPLPEMRVASMKMQMVQKKAPPKSVSVVSLSSNYRYKIMPGNNSRVVMTAMRKRPWWHAILGNNNNSVEDDINDLSAIQPTFLWEMIRRACRYRTSQFHNTLMNHIQRNACLVTKKGLYLSLKAHCQEHQLDILSIVPRTYYLAPGEHSKSMKDDDMEEFLQYCQNHPEKKPEELVWILKPASKTNRGFGIKVVQGLDRVINIVQRGMSANSCDGRGDACCVENMGNESGEDEEDDEIEQPINNNKPNANNNTNNNSNVNPLAAYDANPLSKQARMIARTDGYIVQAYLERPLLVHGRKFDIRCFVLVTVLPSARRSNNISNINTSTLVTNNSEEITNNNDTRNNVDEEARALATAAAAVEEQLNASTSASAIPAQNKQGKRISVSPGKTRNSTNVSNNTTASGNNNKTNNVRTKEVRAYFFQEAYIRTSCKKYVNGNFSDRETHLTNDAVQKHAKSYGQFEEGNKLSLQEWEQVLLQEYPAVARPGIVQEQIYPEIKRLSKISIASVAVEFAQTDIHKSFELFGYDYMIKEDLSPVLIEVNTNPCLEFVCPLLTQVITDVIEHTVRLTVDKELPPPPKNIRTKATEEAIAAINSMPIKFDPLYP